MIREIRKYEYIEKEKSFLDEIKSILHGEKKKKKEKKEIGTSFKRIK